jgi:hypothetical protein
VKAFASRSLADLGLYKRQPVSHFSSEYLEMPPKPVIIAASIIGGIILLAALALLYKRFSRRAGVLDPRPAEAPPTFSPPRLEGFQDQSRSTTISGSPSGSKVKVTILAELTPKILDPDLREHLEGIASRIQEEGPNFDKGTSMTVRQLPTSCRFAK